MIFSSAEFSKYENSLKHTKHLKFICYANHTLLAGSKHFATLALFINVLAFYYVL